MNRSVRYAIGQYLTDKIIPRISNAEIFVANVLTGAQSDACWWLRGGVWLGQDASCFLPFSIQGSAAARRRRPQCRTSASP
ncbi:MAG: hypothetical protein AAFN93_30265, partial [Bacteroidota bacterium]